jgi:hypothetical protein
VSDELEKDVEGSGRGLVLRYSLDGLRKTTKYVTQDSRSPGRNLNPEYSEYEEGVLIT